MQDGRLVVYDHGHRSFLVFGSDGGFTEQFRVGQEDPAICQPPPPTSLVGKKLRALPDGRLLAFGGISAGPGRPIEVIDLGAGRDTLVVAWDMATPPEPEKRAVPTSSTDMIVAHGMRRPHFAPPLLVDVLSDGRVAVVDSIGYQVKMLSTRGTAVSVLERSLRPRDVTPAIKQSVRNAKEQGLAEDADVASEGTTVVASGVSPETVEALLRQSLESDLQELTFAAHVPVIAAMAVDSEDRIWVARTGDDGIADGPTDIFSSEGEYVGTLAAADLRIPTAFGPGGLMAYVEKDEFDAAVVRVIRLLRLAPDGAPGT